jgi:putative ATP-dependent endonuclease of OLD family
VDKFHSVRFSQLRSSMHIRDVHIRNFRCLEDVEVRFDDVTSFIGPNGAGKSTVLRSLDWFFNGEKGSGLTFEDLFAGADPSASIAVTVTFDRLTDNDRRALGDKYAPTGSTTFSATRTWTAGEDKTSGVGRVFPAFEEIRAMTGKTDRRKAYSDLAANKPDLKLPPCRTGDEVDAAMIEWETHHPDKLEISTLPSTHFFGFNGKNVLSGIFDFVFVSADLRAGEQSLEGRKTVLGRILERTLEREALETAYENLAEEFGKRQKTINSDHLDEQLVDLSQALSEEVAAFTAGRTVRLTGLTPELKPTSPSIRLAIVDALSETSIERQGHGFQRALLIGALKLLAERREGDNAGSIITLAIEEPELFQHPTQARVFSSVLRRLASDDQAGIQVAYATHSPYFVDASYFDQVRRVTRLSTAKSAGQVIIKQASLDDVKHDLANYVSTDALAARWDQVCTAGLAEALFSDAVVLVEGSTDKAILEGAANRAGQVPLENLGIAVAEAGAKSSLFIPHAILARLGIPSLTVFDSDSGSGKRAAAKAYKPAKSPEELKKLEADEIKQQAASNTKILKYFGTEAVDFPSGKVTNNLFAVDDNLEEVLAAEWPGWEVARAEIVTGGRGAPKKNAATYKLASAESVDIPGPTIQAIIELARALVSN